MGKRNRYKKSTTKASKRSFSWSSWWTSGPALILFAGVIFLLSAGLAGGYHSLLGSRLFPLEEMEIHGIKHLHRDQVVNTLGVPKGTGMLSLRLGEMEARVTRLDWVRSARLRLDFPARLVVEIKEQVPSAVFCNDRCYLMNNEGVLFTELKSPEDVSLPRLTGLQLIGASKGARLPEAVTTVFSSLLSQVSSGAESCPFGPITEYVWTEQEGFTLKSFGGDVEVVLGLDRFGEKISRLGKVLAFLGNRESTLGVGRIDLDFGRRAYVTERLNASLGLDRKGTVGLGQEQARQIVDRAETG